MVDEATIVARNSSDPTRTAAYRITGAVRTVEIMGLMEPRAGMVTIGITLTQWAGLCLTRSRSRDQTTIQTQGLIIVTMRQTVTNETTTMV